MLELRLTEIIERNEEQERLEAGMKELKREETLAEDFQNAITSGNYERALKIYSQCPNILFHIDAEDIESASKRITSYDTAKGKKFSEGYIRMQKAIGNVIKENLVTYQDN